MHFWQNEIQTQNADLIVCTSEKYLNYYKNSKNVIHIPHGISEDEFNIDLKKVIDIQNEYGNYVIMVGAIAKDIDLNLIKAIVNDKKKLVVIGSELIDLPQWEEIKTSQYLTYLGSLHAKKLKNYINAAKACLIVYNFVSLQNNQVSRSPLKALNYLAQKKPIVTTIDSGINELKNEGIYQAENENEFLDFVKKAYNNELNVNNDKVTSYLKHHKYPLLIEDILKHLEK